MNLVADGCWGAEAVLMLPLTPPSFAPGPGGTHGAVPIPFTAYSWPQHEPYSCASQSPHICKCNKLVVSQPSPAQKSISAAPHSGGDPHHPFSGRACRQLPLSALLHPMHSQPQSSCTPHQPFPVN